MTPERVRELMGWPPEVPDALLEAHLDLAGRTLAFRVPAAARTGPDWGDALAWEAARTALPLLHAFALSGAAKVGRLEGAVEWRFLTPSETEALQRQCAAQVEACIARMLGAPAETEKGGFWAAI
jgi:hypothetical protein